MIVRIGRVAFLLVCAGTAWAYPVGPALTLDKLTEEADLVFKGTAISSQPVVDDWFKPVQGFAVEETRFRIISVIKGEKPGATASFRHYNEDPQPTVRMFQPQYYRFEIGRTYIVFAKRGEMPGTLRQIWMNHTMKEDQGALLCANDKPAEARTVKEIVWTELMTMLASAEVEDVGYAIRQLDEMSGPHGEFNAVSEFERTDVVAAVRSFMNHAEPKIAQASIGVVGSHNPYMSDERAIHWLATVGSAETPGMGKMDAKMQNTGGALYWKDLVALAESQAPNETRAAAILALGLVREPSLVEPVQRWLADPSPAIRAAATVVLADFPGPETQKHLASLAGDKAAEVRVGVARAIGFGQMAELAGILAKLLSDGEFKVRQAAAMSVLSFSPKDEAIANVFRANIENDEFEPLFLIALARERPEDYLEPLAEAVEQQTEPKDFWGGQLPAFTAWEILFKYLRAQPAGIVQSGKLDRYLD
ncbi:MAG: HEAT repeat domain-containing protein, partial [Candidatus Hydrogenedentales bacterium]